MLFLPFSFGPPSEVPKCQCWAVVGYGGAALGVAGIEVHAVNVARILPRIVPRILSVAESFLESWPESSL